MAFLGLYLAACGLLIGAGTAKLLHPRDTARAIREVIPLGTVAGLAILVRVLAATEICLGLIGLAYPDRIAALFVAASYAAFALFVLYARARGGSLATCGCFGTPDTPPTVLHAVVCGLLSFSAAAVAWAGGQGGLPDLLRNEYGHGIPLVAASAVCGWLVYLTMSTLPKVGLLRRADPARGSDRDLRRAGFEVLGAPNLPSQPHRALGFCGKRLGHRRVGIPPQAGDRLRPMRLRERRLQLRRHLLCRLYGVLLCAERRVQLLPGQHDHGRMVDGRGIGVLRRSPLLHGLQCGVRVPRRVQWGLPVLLHRM